MTRKQLLHVLVILVGVVSTAWEGFVWLLACLFTLFGSFLPDPGSIISWKVPLWVAILVALSGPVFFTLKWAAFRSVRGGQVLTTLLGVAFILDFWLLPTRGEIFHLCLWPVTAWIVLLWWWHASVVSER